LCGKISPRSGPRPLRLAQRVNIALGGARIPKMMMGDEAQRTQFATNVNEPFELTRPGCANLLVATGRSTCSAMETLPSTCSGC